MINDKHDDKHSDRQDDRHDNASNNKPSKATPEILANLAHAVATIYALAAQVLEPDWSEWTPDERTEAIDSPVQELRTLAPHLETLHPQAGTITLQQAIFLARSQPRDPRATIGHALTIARTGAILNHWLQTLTHLHSRQSKDGPLTLGELFQQLQTSQDPRQQLALQDQTRQRALETSAHHLTTTAAELTDQALGLLWLHGCMGSQGASHLTTTINLFTQASGVILCAGQLLGPEPIENSDPSTADA